MDTRECFSLVRACARAGASHDVTRWICPSPPEIPGYSNAVPNNIYYRITSSPSAEDSERIAADVAAWLPSEPALTPSVVAVVTWFAVAPYTGAPDPAALNTYQAVFVSDAGGRSFVTLWCVPYCRRPQAACAVLPVLKTLRLTAVRMPPPPPIPPHSVLQLRQPCVVNYFGHKECHGRLQQGRRRDVTQPTRLLFAYGEGAVLRRPRWLLHVPRRQAELRRAPGRPSCSS